MNLNEQIAGPIPTAAEIYGSMLLGVPNEPEAVEKCRAFLAAAENVTVEEV